MEVRVRVREPYVSKQVEQTREKWLIIDRFIQRPGADVRSLYYYCQYTLSYTLCHVFPGCKIISCVL